MKRFKISSGYSQHQKELNKFIDEFDKLGEPFGDQQRNSLRLFQLNDETLNIKSFKIPNIFNKVAYRFLRKSKAQRSYEYAHKLVELSIGTPEPIGYYEFITPFLFKESYYISKQLECQLTYRELINDINYPDREAILRAFTRFTHTLHEKNVNFLDHSPGNTLITATNGDYEFYLVDLNRMKFEELDFETRMKNFARLTPEKEMVEIMSDEYAKCIGKEYEFVFKAMWAYTEAFFYKFYRKKRLKKRYLFWRKWTN